MALAEPDDETAMGSQVLGPEKSRVLGILGPGLITGASDDDPSGIATYSQVGAQFGFSISWKVASSRTKSVEVFHSFDPHQHYRAHNFRDIPRIRRGAFGRASSDRNRSLRMDLLSMATSTSLIF